VLWNSGCDAVLGIYNTVGYPSVPRFRELMARVSPLVDFLELGIPTTNPKYDGPIIRETHLQTSKHLSASDALRSVRGLGNVVIMAYAEDFKERLRWLLEEASSVEAISVLLPDLLIDTPELLHDYIDISKEVGLNLTFFITSRFPHRIVKYLAGLKPLFIYMGLMASTGIRLPVQVERNVAVARELVGDTKLIVGFSISTPQMVLDLLRAGADGVVIGSAFIRRLEDDPVGFVREISRVVRSQVSS